MIQLIHMSNDVVNDYHLTRFNVLHFLSIKKLTKYFNYTDKTQNVF